MTNTPLDEQKSVSAHPMPNVTAPAEKSNIAPPAEGNASPSAASPKTAQEVWAKEKKPWAATPGGRLAIRAVSRGVIGAAFYTLGTQKIIRDMPGYSLDKKPENLLQHIARGFDIVAGKPIEKVFNAMGKDGSAIVSFRPSLKTGARTLGEDAIYNTFDFAMASAGDSLGREIIGLFDPAVEKKWRGSDGKVKFPQAVKSLAGAGGRIFLSQAEDWFVAVPYTFQQKFQRKLINKFSPGFEYTADSTLHGSCYKLDENGRIKGTYAWEGALDLQGRFTGYNFGTGLFRDMVGAVKNSVAQARDKDKLDKAPEKKTPATMFKAGKHSLQHATHYLLNRFVKTAIIMTPSIPIFSAMRLPQNRDMGMGLMPDGTEVALGRRTDFDVSDIDRSQWSLPNRAIDAALDPMGKAANSLSEKASGFAQSLARSPEGKAKANDFARTYVNATLAYTPYIYAKNEFAQMWDNQTMDTAVDRVVDGLFNGKGSEIKAGAKDIAKAIIRKKGDEKKGFSAGLSKKSTAEGASFREQLGRESAAGNWQEQLSTGPASAGVSRRG